MESQPVTETQLIIAFIALLIFFIGFFIHIIREEKRRREIIKSEMRAWDDIRKERMSRLPQMAKITPDISEQDK